MEENSSPSAIFLARFNPQAIQWFVRRFGPKEEVSLLVWSEEDPEVIYKKVGSVLEDLGYDIESVPDIVISPVSSLEAQFLHLVESVNVIIDDGLEAEFIDVARRMGKEVISLAELQALDQIPQPESLVSIVIPVFNKVNFTRGCLQALFRNTGANIPFEVIVVDNGSQDETPVFLRVASKLYPYLKVVRNDENKGFAAACNQGAALAKGKYVLFLNNDTEVQRGWLEPLLEVLEKDPRVGAVGNRLLFPDGTIQHAGVVVVLTPDSPFPLGATHAYVKQPASFPEAERPFVYQAVTAACVMVRRSTFWEVGGFDEGYWNGYEDVDFCFKLGEKGWIIVYEPRSVVIHYESQSSPEQRFGKVGENTKRLNEKWRGKVIPDFVLEGGIWCTNKVVKIGRYQPPLFSILILTRNNLRYTQLCLQSIQKYTSENYEILVVDNDSTDGTKEYLGAQERVTLIESDVNLGFALGNNRGLLEAKGDYIVFLNNDVVVTEGWLTRLCWCAESDPKVGIVGPRSNYVAGPQLVQNVPYGEDMEAMHVFAQRWSLEHARQYEDVSRVIGFCMLVKRKVIDKIGGFDPLFGKGNFEDDDFCIRAQLAGFKVKIAHDVFIHHFGNRTFASEGFNYRQLMLANWEKFKKKWKIPPNFSLERGYPVKELLKQSFDPQQHFVALQIPSYPLVGVRSLSYLGPLDSRILQWYLSRFSSQDDVTLVLYEEGEAKKVMEQVVQMVNQLGYDPDESPDILVVAGSLEEITMASVIQAVNVVLFCDELPEAWKRWVSYLDKSVENIEKN